MRRLIVIILALASGSTTAETTQPAPEPWYERAQLTGKWAGRRDALETSGTTPFLVYDSIFAANVSGGIDSDREFTGQVYGGLILDLEKLAGLDGTIFKISMINRHGDSIGESVGGIYDPMTIFGGQTTYLYDAWLETTLDDTWALKFGRMSADQDFVTSPLYGYSLSTAINGPIRALLLENVITSFPSAVWGARLKYRPSEQHQLQIGAYQIDEDLDVHDNGVNFRIRSDDGVSILIQYDWTPEVAGRPRVYAGVVNSFFDFDEFNGTGTTDHFVRWYGHADIEVKDGLRVFGLLAWSDQDEVARTPFQASIGANYKGLIPSRPHDRTIAFVTHGQISDAFGRSLGEDKDFERVYELGHRIQITPAFYIQPSVQYIQNPGGTGDIDDAVVVGAWVGVLF